MSLIADIRHYLDENQELIQEPRPARRLAEHLCAIVEATTARPRDEMDWDTGVRCRRRPGRKPCQGNIVAGLHGVDGGPIQWLCPICGDDGYIYGWQDTQWDRSGPEQFMRPISDLPAFVVLINGILRDTQQQYRSLAEMSNLPHALDHPTVAHIIEVYSSQAEDTPLFETQFAWWEANAQLTSHQKQDIQALRGKVEQIRQLQVAILEWAEKWMARTAGLD